MQASCHSRYGIYYANAIIMPNSPLDLARILHSVFGMVCANAIIVPYLWHVSCKDGLLILITIIKMNLGLRLILILILNMDADLVLIMILIIKNYHRFAITIIDIDNHSQLAQLFLARILHPLQVPCHAFFYARIMPFHFRSESMPKSGNSQRFFLTHP